MRTKWSGTVSQDAVLIKLRRRLKLILSSWAVHKKERKGVYEKEGEKKEKEAKNEPTHNSALSKGRDNATSYENAKAREKKWARPTLGFSCVVFAGVNCTVPPPPQRKKNSLNCLLYLLHWKLLILPHFLCFLYFSAGSVFPPAIPFSFSLYCMHT